MTSTIAADGITASIPALDLDLEVREYKVSIDDARSPYGEVSLLCAAPDADDLDLIDPRDKLRVEITLDREIVSPTTSTQTRDFDLYLHARELQTDDGTMTLTCRTDEAQLIDDMLGGTTVDSSAEAHQASLRAIVNHVLDEFDAELEAGTADADYTVTWNAMNLMPNPNVRASIGNFLPLGSNAAITRQTGLTGSPVPGITTYTRTTMSGSSTAGAYPQSDTVTPYALVSPDKQYTIGVWVRASVAKTINFANEFLNSGGTNITGSVILAAIPLAAGVWTRISATVTAPAGAARIGPHIYAASAWAAANTFDTLGWTVVEGTEDAGAFDGASSDSHYTYGWTGTANASSSTRVRTDNRARDVLKREPGERAWDFLSSLVDAAGLRLFCDEQRQWWLVDPADYTVPGSLRVSEGFNATSASETIDLSAGDRGVIGYAETVVVKYTWRDTDGEHIAYDAAGEAHGVGRLIEVNRPYPGPGAAQALLKRSQGKGRTLDLTALNDLTATPGQELVATIPGAPIQTGRVASVEWGSEGVMRVGSRGLTDTPETSWSLAEGAWEAVAGIQWNQIDEAGE